MKHYSVEAFLAAQNGKEVKQAEVDTGTADIAALKARADELGVAYADSIGAKKLAERIAAKEKELADGAGDGEGKAGTEGAGGASQS